MKNFFLLLLFFGLFNCNKASKKIKNDPILEEDIFIANLDSITKEYQITNKINLLDSLNKLACTADGYKSEAIDNKISDFYETSFITFTDYLYNNKGSCIESSFVRGSGADLFGRSQVEKKQIINYMINKLDTCNCMNSEKIAYIKNVLRKINPNALD